MHVLVTGANGFVGRALVERLVFTADWDVTAAVRAISDPANLTTDTQHCHNAASLRWIELGDLAESAADPAWFIGVDVIIHCAARVHVMRESAADPLAEFRAVNVEGTLKLARAAFQAGVKRFVFLSTVKVHGEETAPGAPFAADSLLAPADPYAISKMEAEQGLLKLAAQTGLELVIIRPPLVYGPGVGGNFRTLLKWADKAIPLPFGAICNRRSLVALKNLIDLIRVCATHPKAPGRAFLVSDGDDMSTPALLMNVAQALNKPLRLFSVPPRMLDLVGSMTGRRAAVQRLRGSLQVDISQTRNLLGWEPVVTTRQGLAATVAELGSGPRPGSP